MTVLVVTPVYSTYDSPRQTLLAETLRSVRAQTWRDYLHVVVDDGSSDGLWPWLQEEAQHDPRLLVCQQAHAGSCSAVNYGLRAGMAQQACEHVTIIHSDDLLTPRSLALRVAACTEETPFVFSAFELIFEDGRRPQLKGPPQHATAEALYASLLQHNCMNSPTMFWHADFLLHRVGLFDPTLRSVEDWDMALRTVQALCQSGRSFAKIEASTARYRFHAGNLHKQNIADGTRALCCMRILAKHLSGWRYARGLLPWARQFILQRFPGSAPWIYRLQRMRRRTDRVMQRLVGPGSTHDR